MISVDELHGARCVGEDPLLFDLDTHHHGRLGSSSCLMCHDARDLCRFCPAKRACLEQGVRLKATGLIWGGMILERGRPRHIR